MSLHTKHSKLGYIIDLLGLILDWRLAAIIRALPMPKPGEILLIKRNWIVKQRLLLSKWPTEGPIPIIEVEDVNDLKVLSFERLTAIWNEAYAAYSKGTYGQFEADGRETRRQEQECSQEGVIGSQLKGRTN